MNRTVLFAREQLRAPFNGVLLVTVPALFVVAAASALRDFADILGGSLAGDAAVGLSAGWAAAFLSGMLGFFQATSSRGADRRLALAGLGSARVAVSRIGASVVTALVASAAAFGALELRAGIAHPGHAAIAVAAFALIYLAVGVVVGSSVTAPLEGSLLVVFIFLLDAFAGPGMSASPPLWSISQTAADVLIAAGAGTATSSDAWLELAFAVGAALLTAFGGFVFAARRRS